MKEEGKNSCLFFADLMYVIKIVLLKKRRKKKKMRASCYGRLKIDRGKNMKDFL